MCVCVCVCGVCVRACMRVDMHMYAHYSGLTIERATTYVRMFPSRSALVCTCMFTLFPLVLVHE